MGIFIFEFVNNFTSLVFTAFAQRQMNDLYFALFIQLGAKQVISNIMEIGGPSLGTWKLKKKQDKENMRFSWADVLAGNDPYDTFDDFKEIVIQFGYVLFFA